MSIFQSFLFWAFVVMLGHEVWKLRNADICHFCNTQPKECGKKYPYLAVADMLYSIVLMIAFFEPFFAYISVGVMWIWLSRRIVKILAPRLQSIRLEQIDQTLCSAWMGYLLVLISMVMHNG